MSRPNCSRMCGWTTSSSRIAGLVIFSFHGSADQRGNACKMIFHRARRGLRIAACDTFVDLTMAFKRRILGASDLQRDRPLARQPLDEPVMDGGINRVARDRRQHIVEGDVSTL